MEPVYYNDNDPYIAQRLRNLILAGEIPYGDVDDRSIEEVSADDIRHYRQCHWFAGIGGWALAVLWSGWDPAEPVWTGSCPCQPVSLTGKRKGASDARHLWPPLWRLVKKRKPPTFFGEQVAGRIGYEWLTAVRIDLEVLGYRVAASNLSATALGAPHERQRVFFVGDADSQRLEIRQGVQGLGREKAQGDPREAAAMASWRTASWVLCKDGKKRAVAPGIRPLDDGVPDRVGQVRGYGNAIVPELAAKFIRAYMRAR